MSNKQTLLFILLLFFAAVSCKKSTAPFSNVIDLKNSPSCSKDDGLNVFFDLGSWMGFSLSDEETNTGFSGPYILGLEHGIWSSNNFTSIDLISENGNSLLTNLNYSKQKYFPGKLENQLHFEDIELGNGFSIISNLIFTSDKSAIISSKIINNGMWNMNFTPQWKGEIFDEIGNLINNDTVLITLLDKNQKIFVRPINDNEFNILTDSNKYVITLNNIILKPKESKTYTIEIQYHPDQKSIKKNTNRINVTQTIEDNHLRWKKYLEITKTNSLSKIE